MTPPALSRGRGRPLTCTLAVVIAATAWAWAQTTSSSLTGRVRDADGRPVADAVVQAQSAATGAVRTGITDESGVYRIDVLPPGTWRVVARTADGETSETRSVTLSLQQIASLDLRVGTGLTESVKVVGTSPLMDSRQIGGELRVDGSRAEALPISGRVLTDLALLDASVKTAAAGNFYGERGAVFVLNGQSGRANSFLVDGLDNNDQTSGTSLNSYFSQQVIKEFVVLTHQYAPEFGRASGGILNIVTERGTNEPMGEAFIQGTRTGWNRAGDFVSSLPNPDGRDDAVGRVAVGFKWGGAFREDRAHYFIAYEHQDADDVSTYTGVGRDGIRGGVGTAPARDDNLFFRTDFNLNADNFLMVRLSGDDRETEGLNIGGPITPEAGFRVEERDVQVAASLTTIVAPNLLNEARLLVGSSSFDQFANSGLSGVDRPQGMFGGNPLNRQLRDENRVQLLDNVTWRRGSHTMKFGADVTWSSTDIDASFNPNGNFLYDTNRRFEPGDGFSFENQTDCVRATGPDVVDCPGVAGVDDDGDGLIDEPGDRTTYPVVYTLVRGDASNTLDDTRIALFAQDSWQVGPRLLLDYGLRYDLSTYVLPRSARVESTIPNGGAGRDWDNLAPRLGFTFVPGGDDRFVLRGGVGVFYDKLVLAFPAVAAVTSGTEIGLLPGQGLGLELTEVLVDEFGTEPLDPILLFPEALILKFSTGKTMDTPYAIHANIGVEQAIGQRASWRANLVRARGHDLPLMRDLNPIQCFLNENDPFPPDTCSVPDTPDDLDDRKKIPVHVDSTTGSIAAVVTEGESWYWGLDLGWTWRSDQGWLSLSYTLSRSEDLGPDPLKGGIYLPPDSLNLAGERGRSDHDRRHRLVLAAEGPLPWGMRASGVLHLASGAPFNVTTGRDENLDGIKSDRPDGVRRNTGEDTPLAAVNALRAEQGLLPVTNLDEPSLARLDLRVSKPFTYRDGEGRGEFFVQVFNLLDRENFGWIEGRAIAEDFGRPIALAGPPLTVEAGLKVGF